MIDLGARRAKIAALVLAIVGNVVALPGHQVVAAEGDVKAAALAGPALLYALRNVRDPEYRAPAAVQAMPIYELFRTRFQAAPVSQADPVTP